MQKTIRQDTGRSSFHLAGFLSWSALAVLLGKIGYSEMIFVLFASFFRFQVAFTFSTNHSRSVQITKPAASRVIIGIKSSFFVIFPLF